MQHINLIVSSHHVHDRLRACTHENFLKHTIISSLFCSFFSFVCFFRQKQKKRKIKSNEKDVSGDVETLTVYCGALRKEFIIYDGGVWVPAKFCLKIIWGIFWQMIPTNLGLPKWSLGMLNYQGPPQPNPENPIHHLPPIIPTIICWVGLNDSELWSFKLLSVWWERKIAYFLGFHFCWSRHVTRGN